MKEFFFGLIMKEFFFGLITGFVISELFFYGCLWYLKKNKRGENV